MSRREILSKLIESQMGAIIEASIEKGKTMKEAEEAAMVETLGITVDWLCDQIDELEKGLRDRIWGAK